MANARYMLTPLGDEPPILAFGRRAPDRREVSVRWLSGTFLTGVASTILMGIALSAALDGRQQLAIPAEAYAAVADDTTQAVVDQIRRGERIVQSNLTSKPSDKEVLEVSTIVQDGGKNVVRRQPFVHVKMALAVSHPTQEDYPRFDPMAIFSSGEASRQPAPSFTGTIYGSDVETEVSLVSQDFPVGGTGQAYAPPMAYDEVEEMVRTNGSVLTDGDSQVSSLYYVDPRRFADDSSDIGITLGLTAKVIETNLSVAERENISQSSPEYADDVIPIRREMTIEAALIAHNYSEAQASDVSGFLTPLLGFEKLPPGYALRIGIIQSPTETRIVRASVYAENRHVLTAAVNDDGAFVKAPEPQTSDAIRSALADDGAPVIPSHDLPRIYDGIYRSALAYGMNTRLTGQLVKLLASSVDFKASLKPADSLEVLFTATDDKGQITDASELLFVYAKFGDKEIRLYRYQDPQEGWVDYFDQDGKSTKRFLIRNPVPNGVFRSGFGMRRHPILGYKRMHTGVDWAAPRGTPIIAAGDGIVEKAGWDKGGYGKQTLIRHANGYVTSYSHQNAISKDVFPGASVRQGQIIGWIGTTGLSTGPHLHYELIVNGNKVDPLGIRLPEGKSLKDTALARFEIERRRIDTLLGHDEWQVAAN